MCVCEVGMIEPLWPGSRDSSFRITAGGVHAWSQKPRATLEGRPTSSRAA